MDLAPEIIKMRDALLERIEGKSLKEVGEVVNEILLNETQHVNRLAALAARVKVLRNHINKNFTIQKNKPNNLKKVALLNKLDNKTEPENQIKDNEEKNESWTRVEMLKSGIVNGVRFPEGVVIDVNSVDAEKLVNDGLSKIISSQNKENEGNSKEQVEAVMGPKKETITEPEQEKVVEPKKETITEPEQEKKLSNIDDKKILKTKSTKITEETIELTDSKAVAEALGLNEEKKKAEEPDEIEEVLDMEELETGKKR